jgi:hypothetical protein
MEPIIYTRAKTRTLVNYATDTIKMALVSSGYTPNVAHSSLADISAYVLATTTLTGKAWTAGLFPYDGVFSADNPTFPAATGNWQYTVMYKEGGTLICYWAWPAPVVLAEDEITLDFNSIILAGAYTSRWLFELSKTSTNKSAAEVITATISRTFLGEASIRLAITGGKSQVEDFGLGKNFTGSGLWHRTLDESLDKVYESSYTDISFGAGEQNKTVTIAIYDNQVAEPDRELTISLSDQTTGTIIGGNKTLTIVDDNRVALVTADLAKDGSDVSAAIQAMVDAATLNPGTVLYFPQGIYGAYNVTWKEGITIAGDGRTKTVFRRSPGFYSTRANRWERMFAYYDSDRADDAKPFAMMNCGLDGGSVKWGYKFTFTGVPNSGEYFKLDNTATTNSTWQYTYGTTINPIGATAAAVCANTKAALQTAGWMVYDESSTVIYVYRTTSFDRPYHQIPIPYENCNGLVISTMEQASVMLLGKDSPTHEGQVTIYLDNIQVNNNDISDGIFIRANSVNHIYHVDDGGTQELFGRGFLILSGGNSTYRVKDINCGYFHIEIDGYGHNGAVQTDQIDCQISDIDCKVFALNFGDQNNTGNVFAAENVAASLNWVIGGYSASVPTNASTFSNCDFTGISYKSIANPNMAFNITQLYNPGKIVFSNTHFRVPADAAGRVNGSWTYCSAANIGWHISGVVAGQSVQFDDCHFHAPALGYNRLSGVAHDTSTIHTNHRIILNRCDNDANFASLFGTGNLGAGLNVTATDCDYYGTYLFTILASAAGTAWRVALDNAEGSVNTTRFCYLHTLCVEDILLMQDLALTKAQNVWDIWSFPYNTAFVLLQTNLGRVDAADGILRTITGDNHTAQGPGCITAAGLSWDRLVIGEDNHKPDSMNYAATWVSE